MSDDFGKHQELEAEALMASYGKFCLAFESAVWRLREAIETFLKRGGLSNQGMIQVLLANQTAEPLRALFLPLLLQIQELDSSEMTAVNSVLKQFQKLIAKRNEFVHATWIPLALGQADIDYSTVRGFKYHRGNSASSHQLLQLKRDDLDAWRETADMLGDSFMALRFAIGFREPITSAIKKNSHGQYLPNFTRYWPET
jgi:hypothetical protein